MKNLAEQMKSSGKENDELNSRDSINRLPDELIVVIFDIISHVKCLCRCTLISKRFASLILQTRNVTIQINNWNPFPESTSPTLPQKIFQFFTKPLITLFNPQNNVQPRVWCIDVKLPTQSPIPSPVRHFLKQLMCIDTLNLHLSPYNISVPSNEDSFVKWKAVFKRLLISKFKILFAKSIIPTTPDEKYNVDDVELTPPVRPAIEFALHHLNISIKRRMLLLSTRLGGIEAHNTMVTDSENQGRVCMSKEEITECIDLILGPYIGKTRYLSCKMWYVPVFHLPLSRVVMKDVKLVILSYESSDDGTLSFEGEEAVSEDSVCSEGEEAVFEHVVRTINKQQPYYES